MKKKLKTKQSTTLVQCPFCGEAEDIQVDAGGGEHQTYTEDCPVCCRPRVVHVSPGEFPGELQVWLEREE